MIDLLAVAATTAPDSVSGAAVAARASQVLRPAGALSRLDEVAVWLAAWQRTERPRVERSAVVIFAGDHGVAADGVSAYPSSVTAAMVTALRTGDATAAVMAHQVGAELVVSDVGVGRPCGNIRTEPALSPEQLASAVTMGRRAIADAAPLDLLVLGEVGIGNTTAAAAISLALLGGRASDWVGPGSGLDEAGVEVKREVVQAAVNRIGSADPLETLRQLGGWELAAMTGAVLEARRLSIPVLLDGFVVTASVMPLEIAHPGFLDHCWPGHVSAEPGHQRLVARLGRPPVLDLDMRLGEGSGALAALPLVAMAARCVVDVATFDEVGLG